VIDEEASVGAFTVTKDLRGMSLEEAGVMKNQHEGKNPEESLWKLVKSTKFGL
jgi:hypothetical protein